MGAGYVVIGHRRAKCTWDRLMLLNENLYSAMYLRRLPCMAVTIRDTRQAGCVRAVIKLCSLTVLESETGHGRRCSRRGCAGKLGERAESQWDEVRDACSKKYMDVDVDVDVDVVEQRRQSLAGIAQASGFVRHTRGTGRISYPWELVISNLLWIEDGETRLNVTGPDGKTTFCIDMGGWEE